MRKKINLNRVIFIATLGMITIYYLVWAFELKFNSNPDELMRYLVPKFIYKYGRLPTGYDKEVVYHLGNWSYAFYPQMLGGLFSAFFMKVGSLLSTKYLVFMARLTSVLAGIVTVSCVGLTVNKVTKSFKLTIFSMLFIAFLPQFTYLSAYVNNDIIAVCGASMIMYSLYSGSSSDGYWNFKNIILLASGIIICTLGYLNSLGFVLVGVLCFGFSLYQQVNKNRIGKSRAMLLTIILVLIVGVACLPFYARNALIYHGDFLGMKSFHVQYLKWLRNGGSILQYPYLKRGSLLKFLTDTNFWETTGKSFVAYFGYMTVQVGRNIYLLYLLTFFLGIFGYYLLPFDDGMNKYAVPSWGMFLGGVITFVLFIYYVLLIDAQPQGRYFMEILPFLTVVETIGLNKVNNVLFKTNCLLWVFMGGYIAINLYCFVDKVYPLIIK